VMAGPVILVTAANRKMTALARQTGEVKWKAENVSQVATVNEETVWIGDTSGEIRLLALGNGEERTAAPTAGIQFFVRNNMDPNVILVTQAGWSACTRLRRRTSDREAIGSWRD